MLLHTLSAAALVLFAAAATLTGQDRLDPVQMGTARSTIALTRGLSSIYTNPAGLDRDLIHPTALDQRLIVSVYGIGGTIGGSYLKSDEFNAIFGSLSGTTSDAQREELGALLQDERLFANGGVNFLTALWRTGNSGTFGLSYGSRAYARINFPDSLPRLIETSNIAAQDYRFVNRGIGVTWLTEFAVSYGKTLGSRTDAGWFPSIGLGLTAKLLGGVGHFDVAENSAIYIDQVNVGGFQEFLVRGGYTFSSAEPENFDIVDAPGDFFSSPFPSGAGLGVGTDLGVNGVIYRDDSREVSYGVVLGNVGTISWSTKARERRALDFRDTIGAQLSNDVFERFEGDLVDVESFSTALPATVRAGLGYEFRREGTPLQDESGSHGSVVAVGIEGELPLNQVPGNTPDARLGAGVAWSPNDIVSLRTGLSFGGITDVGIGLGVGVKPVDWLTVDVGTSELNGVFSGDRLDLTARVAAGIPID